MTWVTTCHRCRPSIRRRWPTRWTSSADLLAQPPVGKVGSVVGDESPPPTRSDEVVALAEALGAPVHGAPLYGRGRVPSTACAVAGMLAPAAAAVNAALSGYDRVLLIGDRGFMAYPYTPGSAVPVDDRVAAPRARRASTRAHPCARWAGRRRSEGERRRAPAPRSFRASKPPRPRPIRGGMDAPEFDARRARGAANSVVTGTAEPGV